MELTSTKDMKAVLNYMNDNDMINIDFIQQQIMMKEREKYLEQHQYEIYKGKDGRWCTYLPAEKNGKRKEIRKKNRTDVEDCVIAHYRSIALEPFIEQVFYEWINNKLECKEIKKQSYDRYENQFKYFFINNKDACEILEMKIGEIDEEILEKFIKRTIVNKALTQKSYSSLRSIVKGMWSYGKKKKYVSLSITNFFGDLDISRRSFKLNMKDKKDEVYTEDEVVTITGFLRYSQNLRCQGLLLSFETGIRIGELASLKPQDIDFSDGTIHIQRTEIKVKNDKGNTELAVSNVPKTQAGNRYIIINEATKETLKKVFNIRDTNSEYLFSENGRRLRSNNFRRKLIKVCETLNIKYKPNHKIRKTYATTLIDNNVDEIIIAEQMGHSDISTTRKCYYYSNKSMIKKREQIENALKI